MKRILDSLAERMPADAVIEDACVGIFWTYVRTQYGSTLSATAHRWCEDPPGALIPQAGSLVGMPVREILSLYESPSLTARSLANAAVGASFSYKEMTGIQDLNRGQDIVERFCGLCSHKIRIALIGHFHFADEMRALGHDLDVFELDGRCGPEDIPSSKIPQILPFADLVVMTSSTLITHSTESILENSRSDARKIIVGPTVPIHPVLWEYGFDAICASIITDDRQVSEAVRQGANHKQLTGCRKVNYVTPEFSKILGLADHL